MVGVSTAALSPIADFERCYRALASRDGRFDGWFFAGIVTTGIYCRPSCPAPVRPKRQNVQLYATAAAAQRAGFRACKRCRPDAAPGSPEWNVRADLVGRAMWLIDDGVLDRDGVDGVARRLHVSSRHLHRLLTAELGAPPLAIARARRAQTARVLIETTEMAFADIAFASGFGSIRQFNDTIREVFAQTPGELRAKRTGSNRRSEGAVEGRIRLRLPYREPFDAGWVFGMLARHALPGVSAMADGSYRRTLSLPNGRGELTLAPADGHVRCELRLDTMRDLATAVARCRRLLDLDADPHAIAEVLEADNALEPLMARWPGIRMGGSVDGFETAVGAIVGQQVSTAGARTLLGRIVARAGHHDGDRTWFPTPPALAEADLDGLGLTGARITALHALARAVDDATVVLDGGAARNDVRASLLALPGVGPWTADVIAAHALGDPDVVFAGDLVVRRAAAGVGLPDAPRGLAERSARWRPWRSYASNLLWAHGLGHPASNDHTAINKTQTKETDAS
jgi:AraC family transcriptional regulator, regulatory protein of adaptative response / DNA-3-methyladenine glycosylase II